MGVIATTLTFELPWPSTDASGLAALSHDTLEPTPILEYKPKLHPKLAEAIMVCMSVNQTIVRIPRASSCR